MRQAKSQCHLLNHNTVDHQNVVTEDYDEVLTQFLKGENIRICTSFPNMKKLMLFWHNGSCTYDTTSQE